MRRLPVNSTKKYDIIFENSFELLASEISSLVKPGCRAFIITDSNVAPLYLDEVKERISGCFSAVNQFIFPAGEQSKTLDTAENALKAMIENEYTRDDIVIALGGGVVGDLSGFVASVYMRGIDFIQIPTTLLSQIDSSIGGKVAVDMDSYKNMIGAFHNPILVYENSACLSTLPDEQFLSGMGEVAKSALLGDRALWEYLTENAAFKRPQDLNPDKLIHILYSTCLIKRNIVEEDPFDRGKRAVLNLGHTTGHAVEKCSNFALSHGICVALGCVCAAFISANRGLIPEDEYNDILNYFNKISLPVTLPAGIKLEMNDVLSAVSKDKKNSSSGLKFILLEKIGEAFVCADVTAQEIEQSLKVIGI